MIRTVFNEWKLLIRNRSVGYLTIFFIVTLILVTWLGIAQNEAQREEQQIAQQHVREQWEQLDDINPHGAAHYGSYAFKSTTALSSMDNGVNTVTGNVLRLEGHVQNEIVYSEDSQSLIISKFGKLKLTKVY